MEDTKQLTLYVSLLRALYLLHQNNHWVSKGENFYENHLLFQRLYESAQENADLAAEKMVGLFGEEVLDIKLQMKIINSLINILNDSNLLETSLKLELAFIKFSEKMYKSLKESDKMSLGLDDMIMSISSKREEAVYLLKQSLDNV